VSKFLKAIERAEHERAGDGAAPPSVDGHAVAPADRGAAVRPSAARATDAVVGLLHDDSSPAYGAPVTRHAAAHEGAFSTLLEPAPLVSPGRLDDHLVSLLEPTSFAAEQYRSARLAIENFRRERGTRLVAVSSPARGDGKTTTTINLAGALAQGQDARVVLVEADLRRPSIAQMLGVYAGGGLTSYLLDPSVEVEQIVQRSAGLAFPVVVAGAVAAMPYEHLKSPRLTALFTTLLAGYDFVVIDTPPALPFPDVGILRDIVDGFVLIVRANRTPREQVRQSIGKIGNDRVLGMIFNADDRMRRTSPYAIEPRRGLREYLRNPLGGDRAA
jgi:capsular exopolysaccharide synthesis family protein